MPEPPQPPHAEPPERPPKQPRELAPLAQKLIEGVVAGGAALAALTGSPEAVGAAAAAPLVSQGLAYAGAIVRQRWRRNAEEMLAEAAHTAELEDDQLLERLLASPARQELLASALEAAAHATLQEKVKALGQALADGALADDDQVDHELLFVRAMVDLEAPHVRVLHLLDTPSVPAAPSYRAPLAERQLSKAPGIGDALGPVLAVLERWGAVEKKAAVDIDQLNQDLGLGTPVPFRRETKWEITPFGQNLLRRLRAGGAKPA